MIPTPPEMAHRLPSQQDLSASRRAEVEKAWGDTWPGDRVPTSTDAEIAYQPLDPGQVSVFRQAMLADRQAREKKRFPSLDNADILFSMPNSSQALAWPTSFFLASLKPEYSIGIDELIQETHQNLLCTTIFLRDVPPIGFLRVPRPEYLTLALAAVGASMTPQKEEQALQLWHTSASQLLGNLEVDNGVARKTDLVKAWTLLETFAFLSSDRIVRRRARMIHGCVKTAVWRIFREASCLDGVRNDESAQSQITNHGRSLISYFVILDLLRAIQYGQSTSFPTALFLRHHHRRCSDSATTADSSVLQIRNESSGDAWISIFTMLADVHSVTHTFGPLTTQDFRIHDTVHRADNTVQMPFSPAHEISQLRQKLSASLLTWKSNHLDSAPDELLLMYYFCLLYNTVPSLQPLYALAGCTHASFSTFKIQRDRAKASEGLPFYRAAISTVWLILETSERIQSDDLPIWAALTVFSAALVLWARKEFAKNGDVDSWSSRSLLPFQQELARMKFSGARDMAAMLSRLT